MSEIKIIDGRKVLIQEVKNTGFVFEPEAPKDFIEKSAFNPDAPLGRISAAPEPPIIFQDGHGWHGETVRSKAEMQFNPNFDSFSCTLYGSAKAQVAYLSKVYGVKTSMSEMANALLAGVVYGVGTSVKKALESWRLHYWVEDSEYPFTKETTRQQFFAPRPVEIELKAMGKAQKWIVYWEQLDYSGNVPHAKIIEALKRTPVLCSGFAWAAFLGEGVYNDYNNPPNHLFPVDDWSDNKNYDLLVYDSYPQDNQYDENSDDSEFVKKLAKNFRIWSAHRIWLEPKKKDLIYTLKYNIKNMLTTVIRDLRGGFWFIKGQTRQKLNKYSLDVMTILSIEAGIKTVSNEELKTYKETTEHFPAI